MPRIYISMPAALPLNGDFILVSGVPYALKFLGAGWEYVALALSGETGPPGPQGPPGNDGPQGSAGPPGTTTWAGITDKPTTFAPVIGAGGGDAVAGNDARLTDARTPTTHAASHGSGQADAVTVAESQVTNLASDLAAKVPTARTISTTVPLTGGGDLSTNRTLAVSAATTAAAGVVELATDGESAPSVVVQGNDTRMSNARTPTAHATSHNAGGADVLAIDAAAATGSLRTLGTGAAQAAAGNDARLADARTPLAHKTSHQDGGADEISVTGLSGLLADNQTPATHDILTKHNGFPGPSGLTFMNDLGDFAAPAAVPGDLNYPETGSLTVATAKYHLTGRRHQCTGAQRITVAGTGRLRIQN